MNTSVFREQHAKIRSLLASVAGNNDFSVPASYATLVKLTASIKVHLRMEDARLYPVLLQSANPSVREKAKRFQKEMGRLASAYLRFSDKWMQSGAIAADVNRFRNEWTSIVSALTDRMNREDDDLYQEFDTLSAA